MAVPPQMQHTHAGDVGVVEDLVRAMRRLLVQPAAAAAEVQLAVSELAAQAQVQSDLGVVHVKTQADVLADGVINDKRVVAVDTRAYSMQ